MKRLATLGSLPQAIERALRNGLCERVLSRDSPGLGRTPPRHPALDRFDRLTGTLTLSAANRVAARSAIVAGAVRFERSRLAQRLNALPAAAVAAASDDAFDLVVGSGGGRLFAIRFAAPRDGLDVLRLVAAISPRATFAQGVLLYDLGAGTTRHFTFDDARFDAASRRRAG
ncbi:MAG: hypothetical protein GIX03_01770 [Candidatus Eremiobacteraeota bacterium]|nr:hypothetical protein [Candidatus Eremiobacteraeota bacterium]MBC5801746.1 hypothetical protein [Candidatus Eremiobacteraeota bacterium]MBC5822619.1 hypothetical protein [Candidatus Eremiobacteraeota bacterium]